VTSYEILDAGLDW